MGMNEVKCVSLRKLSPKSIIRDAIQNDTPTQEQWMKFAPMRKWNVNEVKTKQAARREKKKWNVTAASEL